MRYRVAAMLVTILSGLTLAAPAHAHPLGSVSVNHYHGLRLYPDRIEDFAVIDEAEIPTSQSMSTMDADRSGTVSDAERAAYGLRGCRALLAALVATVDGHPLTFRLGSSDFTLHPGAATLLTGRTECRLRASVDLRHRGTVQLRDTYRGDQVGWHEITASAEGIGLASPPVPAVSASDELRRYPSLLTAPLNQRSVTLHTTETAGTPAIGTTIALPGPLARAFDALTQRFYGIAGSGQLGPTVGLLGVGLALLLGAAHAALPGHGKTVMAAYLAGRRGTVRNALSVGTTVALTHTAGVLVLGLVLTLVAGLAGGAVLGWLGVASGLLIAAIGVTLMRGALRRRYLDRLPPATGVPGPRVVPTLSTVDVPGATLDIIESPHYRRHAPDSAPRLPDGRLGHRSGATRGGEHQYGGYGSGPADGDHQLSGYDDGAEHSGPRPEHRHRWGGLTLGRERLGGDPTGGGGRLERGGLVGLGVAGGLVPSPSALVVLLGAIALGHTWFGVLLVIAYGVGLAATLSAAGLALVALRHRLRGASYRRFGRWSARLASASPLLCAVVVLVVGLVLALRAVAPLLP